MYHVFFKNLNSQPVTVTWNDRDTDDTTIEPGESFVYRDIKMARGTPGSRPGPIGFRVIDKETGNEVTMNGRTTFSIEPSELSQLIENDEIKYEQFSINPGKIFIDKDNSRKSRSSTLNTFNLSSDYKTFASFKPFCL